MPIIDLNQSKKIKSSASNITKERTISNSAGLLNNIYFDMVLSEFCTYAYLRDRYKIPVRNLYPSVLHCPRTMNLALLNLFFLKQPKLPFELSPSQLYLKPQNES